MIKSFLKIIIIFDILGVASEPVLKAIRDIAKKLVTVSYALGLSFPLDELTSHIFWVVFIYLIFFLESFNYYNISLL